MWVSSWWCLSDINMLQQRSLLGLLSVLSLSHDEAVIELRAVGFQMNQSNGSGRIGWCDIVLREGLLRPAVQGMTYPVSELDPICCLPLEKWSVRMFHARADKLLSEDSAVM